MATTPLRICTYNVLAPNYAFGGFHDYCPRQYLEFAYRGRRIIEEVIGLAADILCLQEVERPFLEEALQPALHAQGLQALYLPRSKNNVATVDQKPEEGIALLYNASRFRLMASSCVRLGDLVDASLHGQFWSKVRGLGEGVIWALLHDQELGRPVLAGCTHLFWDPHWPDAKVAQAHLLCYAALALLSRQQLAPLETMPSSAFNPRGASPTPLLPVLLGGDFNSLPTKSKSDAFDTVQPGRHLVSGVYQLLSEGVLDASHYDHPAVRRPDQQAELSQVEFHTSGLQLQSVLASAWGREPPFTNRTATFQGCIDYLWASSAHWRAVHVNEMPYRWNLAAKYDAVVSPASQAASRSRQQGEGFSGGARGGEGEAAEGLGLGQEDAAAGPLSAGRVPKREEEEKEDATTVAELLAASFPAIPNARFPSDHLALGAQLVLRQ